MDNTGFFIVAIITVFGFGGVFLMFMLSNIRKERDFKERLQDLCSKRNCTLTIQPEPKVSYRLDGNVEGRKWSIKNYTHNDDGKFTKGPGDSDLVFIADGLENANRFLIMEKTSNESPESISSFVKEVTGYDNAADFKKMEKVPLGMSEEFRSEYDAYSEPGGPVADLIDSDIQKFLIRTHHDFQKPNFAIAGLQNCLIIRSSSTYNMSELDNVLTLGEELLKRVR